MMKFLQVTALTILAASMAIGVKATDVGTITLDALPGVYPGLGGGEFTAFTSVNYLGNYASSAEYTYGGNTGFETFCIETGVEFSPGSTYHYTLGNISQPVPVDGVGSATPLSYGTAWLYYEFATGNLGNFNYTYGSGREADDNLLQAAIWAFQGGQTYGSYPNGGAGNIYYDAAVSALGGVANADGAYNGTTVQIIQMWVNANDTGAAQNQLVLTGNTPPVPHPTPDGGLTVILLGGALAGMQVLRRKLSR